MKKKWKMRIFLDEDHDLTSSKRTGRRPSRSKIRPKKRHLMSLSPLSKPTMTIFEDPIVQS